MVKEIKTKEIMNYATSIYGATYKEKNVNLVVSLYCKKLNVFQNVIVGLLYYSMKDLNKNRILAKTFKNDKLIKSVKDKENVAKSVIDVIEYFGKLDWHPQHVAEKRFGKLVGVTKLLYKFENVEEGENKIFKSVAEKLENKFKEVYAEEIEQFKKNALKNRIFEDLRREEAQEREKRIKNIKL